MPIKLTNDNPATLASVGPGLYAWRRKRLYVGKEYGEDFSVLLMR